MSGRDTLLDRCCPNERWLSIRPTCHVCTDPNGLEHPFIASYDGRLHLWATRGLGTEIVTAQLDSSGRCDLIKSHLIGDKKSLFSSLSVIEQSGQRILIFAQEREGKRRGINRCSPMENHTLSRPVPKNLNVGPTPALATESFVSFEAI